MKHTVSQDITEKKVTYFLLPSISIKFVSYVFLIVLILSVLSLLRRVYGSVYAQEGTGFPTSSKHNEPFGVFVNII